MKREFQFGIGFLAFQIGTLQNVLIAADNKTVCALVIMTLCAAWVVIRKIFHLLNMQQ